MKQEKLYSERDDARDTLVVDPDKFYPFFDNLIKKLTKNTIFECHYADMIDSPKVDSAVILRCHPYQIEARLRPRGYSDAKIKENAQAELLGDSTSFMLEKEELLNSNRIFEIDTSNPTIGELSKIIDGIFQHPEDNLQYLAGKLSWLSDESIDLTKYQ